MELCSMPGLPEPPSTCISGQQRRRITLEWSVKPANVVWKVRPRLSLGGPKGSKLASECPLEPWEMVLRSCLGWVSGKYEIFMLVLLLISTVTLRSHFPSLWNMAGWGGMSRIVNDLWYYPATLSWMLVEDTRLLGPKRRTVYYSQQ